jgi:hypothetical protein
VSSRWDAYVSAELRIETPDGPVHVYPAPALQTTGQYPDPERWPIAVITAYNPAGADADPEGNVAAQHALVAEVDRRGLTWWPAAGADPSWTHAEESVAIPGLSQPDARELGAKFGQEAIFMLSPTGLRVIDCATGRMSMTGWHIEPGDEDDDEHEHDDDEDYDDEEAGEYGIDVTVHACPAASDGLPGLVLAESRWDDESGAEYLLRIGDRYAIYQTNGDESELDDLDADSDETAVAAFREFLGVPG